MVFDLRNNLHFPLTVFAAEAVRRSSASTARVYLNALSHSLSGWRGTNRRAAPAEAGTIRLKLFDKKSGIALSSA